jgi:hypothetical protein
MGGVDLRSWKRYVVLFRERGFRLFKAKAFPKLAASKEC